MRRFTFYILLAVLTFGVGSFTVFKFFLGLDNANIKNEKSEQTNFQINNSNTQDLSSDVDISSVPEFSQEKVEGKMPFCRNKSIVPVWTNLKTDFFPEGIAYSKDSADCADIFEVKYVDLNDDGVEEILIRGKNFNACMFNGNCGFRVFKKNGESYENILSSVDYFEVTGDIGDQIKQSKTLSYKDVKVTEHISSSDTKHSTYKFDGQKYVERKCVVNAHQRLKSNKIIWKDVSCKKYFD